MDTLLKVINLNKYFGGIHAIADVDLEFKSGEVHCVVGENGAGKSTLGKIIAGIHQPDTGILEFQTGAYEALTPALAKELKIAMVTQELNLMPHLSIAENIFLFEKDSYKNKFLFDRNTIDGKTMELFGQFDLSNLPPVRTNVENLTLAQQQIVEIMKANSQKNNLLIFDEPTTTLSIGEVKQLFTLINELKKENVSIVLITHRLKEVFEIGDVVTVLCDGRLVKKRIPVKDTTEQEIVKWMVGRDIKDFFGKKEVLKIGEPVLHVEDLSDGDSFKNISFTVHKNEILGFAGLIGAGRTEIMETILGMRKQTNGKIFLGSIRIDKKTIKQRIEAGISFVPEDRKGKGLAISLPVNSNMNQVDMNLRKGLVVYEGQFNSDNEEMVKQLQIKLVSLMQRVTNLSGGNQQKVLLSKWLSQDPLIYIFDEPTRGIDVGTKMEIYDLIKRLAKEGKAIIMVSSELQELIAICDRIVVINEGVIASVFDRKGATEPKILEKMIPVK